jgi:DNA-binding transcriptional MerR regulator
LDAESAKDLARTLREIGYSVKAVEEMLKWYTENS